MSDWSRSSVGDFFDLEGGFAFKSADFAPKGIPIIKIKNVKAGYFSEHDFSYVSPSFLSKRVDKIARWDDLLISMSGNRHDGSPETWVGKVALFRKTSDFLINQRVGALRLKPGAEFDVRFASYLLSSFPYQELFISIATSSGGQANLSPAQILKAPLQYPDISVQQAIGEILGALDDKIDLNRRMNETLEQTARALFKDWFVDFGPTKAKMAGQAAYLEGNLWELFPERLDEAGVPEGWSIGTVADIGSVVCGKTPSTKVPEYYGDDMPFITIPDMHGKTFAVTTGKRLSVAGAASQAKKTLPLGSICVSCIATPGLVVLVTEPSQTNQQINSIIPSNENETYFWFWSLGGLGELIKQGGSGGSVLSNLSTGRFSALHMLTPPREMRGVYHKRVDSLFSRMLANEHESRTLAQTRDLLLPKLMSGELHVRDSEMLIQEVV